MALCLREVEEVMSRYKKLVMDSWIILIIVLFIGLSIGYYIGLNQAIASAVEENATQFDHSNCQYPNRLSNPLNGCDNSDPARPECMKIGIEDCDLPTQEPVNLVVEEQIITPPKDTKIECQ